MTAHLQLVAASSSGAASLLLDGTAIVPRHGTESISGTGSHDLAAHRARFGARRSQLGAEEALVDALESVGLTGRGGGHFPTAVKWRSLRHPGPRATVVVNGAEGEPGSAKDAVLLQTRPHLVLDGLVAAIEAIGGADGVVWLHAGADATARSVSRALAERAAAGEKDPPIRVLLAPDRYLSGESTAIIRTLEDGPTLPRYVHNPARPWSEGHRPVLVNNTETMARVGVIAQLGPDAYVATSLLTVINDSHRIVAEVGPSTTFGDVVESLWSSPDGLAPAAALLGGYGGSWVRWDDLRDLPVEIGALRKVGLSVGAGLVAPLPSTACGLEETARLVRYLSSQSARQCGPCVFGLVAVVELCDQLTVGKLSSSGRRRLDRFMGEISGRGACRHPDGAIRMVTSALSVFSDDVARHRRGRTCDAPTYAVLPLPEES
jgi:NADH:ubiquinone oxidoreductase subunit F (NADH-binding)